MTKRVIFYLILVTFISHNILYLFTMMSGKQPRINGKCPLAISFINTPLLFDREELFFNTQIYTLMSTEETISLTRRDIRKGFFSYFNMLYFSHWGEYAPIPGANRLLLSHYFCLDKTFLTKLNIKPPRSVERQIFDSQNKLVHREIIECQK